MNPEERSDLAAGVIRALLWLAAFCFAAGLFLAATLLLRGVPPTPHVGVGRVTVENASKLRDYLTVLLFFLIAPAATIPLFRLGLRENDRLRNAVDGDGVRNLVSLLFVTPFFLAPFLYLTTFKPAWPVLIPVAISQLLPRAVITWQRRMWVRRLFVAEMEPFHALIAVEALAWILFRYIAVGKRIAHIPTLFLELAFIAFFIALFWLAFLLVARIAAFTSDLTTEEALQRIAIAALPLVILPPLAILFVPGSTAIAIAGVMMLIALPLMLMKRDAIDGRHVRNLIAFAILPFLLFCISYASTASLTQWIDLFHRGESLGPASDLLRGKVPFRDVFVLHGLLEDGLLDTWLMQLFGRDLNVVLLRPVVLGSVAVAMLWYLGMVIFDSIPLAMLSILLGAVTTVDNERALLEIVSIALLIGALRRNSKWLALFSGAAAGVTLFYSLDIGLYSVGGGVLALIGSGLLARRAKAVIAPLVAFVAGVVAGATPFLIYLGASRRDRRVLRNVVRRHPAHHRRRLVAAVSGHDHDLPQQPQPAHAGGLRPLRALPIHPQSARHRHRADRARAARRHAPQRRARRLAGRAHRLRHPHAAQRARPRRLPASVLFRVPHRPDDPDPARAPRPRHRARVAHARPRRAGLRDPRHGDRRPAAGGDAVGSRHRQPAPRRHDALPRPREPHRLDRSGRRGDSEPRGRREGRRR